MNRKEFIQYIDGNSESLGIFGDTIRLINNILVFVENNYVDESEQYNVLCELLDGTGLSDEEIKKICL